MEIKIRPTNTELGIESSLNFEMKCQKFFSERVIQFAINYLCFGIWIIVDVGLYKCIF